MGRYYKLTKKLTEEDVMSILIEIRGLENVEKAEYDPEGNGVIIFTKDGNYSDVMDRAVNIFSRAASGTELSFQHFVG